MTDAGDQSNMFISRRSVRVGDIEAGGNSEHCSYRETESSHIESQMEKLRDRRNNDIQVEDVEKCAYSMSRILENIPRYMCNPGHPGRITRIPENLREINVKAYEPRFLSIGPYHHGKPRLQRMERTKKEILKWFLKQKPELTLRDYLQEMKSIETAARIFYSDVQMQSEEFVRMLLLDSLYIVTAFCGITNNQYRMNTPDKRSVMSVENENINERVNQLNDTIISESDDENMRLIAQEDLQDDRSSLDYNVDKPRWFWILFPHDLFLLENQLPFFVLKKMYSLAYSSSGTQLIMTMKDAFENLLSQYTKPDPEMVIPPTEQIHHLLHLCHMFFHPKVQHESPPFHLHESSPMFRLGSAVQLYESGVSFEATSSSIQHNLLDVSFSSSGKMVIPCLHVDDNTESLLRNLIALEQMKYPVLGLNVSAYAVLLLHLVTVPKDVELLRRKGIIEHHLASDKDMMYFINRLSVGLAFDYMEDNYSLKPVFHELRSYSMRRVPRWRAWLKHRYFSNPWTVISLFAASLLLFLTALETYYTILQSMH